METLIAKLKEQEKLYCEEKKKIEYLEVHYDNIEGVLKGSFQAATEEIKAYTSDISKMNLSELDLMATLVHENGHRENADIYHLEMSPEQIYNINQYDELGQKIRELLFRRNEYLKSGDINVFNNESKDFSYYSDALMKKEIDPYESARDPNSFTKEMSFIMNEVMNEWQQKYAPFYDEQNTSVAKEYFCRTGQYARTNDENYDKAIKQILTIGGVDFNQYRTRDFQCHSAEIKKLNEIAQNGDKAQIAAAREKLIREGVTVIPSLQATPSQKRNGYLTRHNPRSSLSLEKDAGKIVITKEEKIAALTKQGIFDGTEDEKDLEMFGCNKDMVIHYKETPKKKKIPDLSDENFIVKPSAKNVESSSNGAENSQKTTASPSVAKRLKELRGLVKRDESLGNGAGKIMQKQLDGRLLMTTMRQQTRY